MEQFLKDVAEDLGVATSKEQKDGILTQNDHPYAHLEKTQVLQGARIFHDSQTVRDHPRQCCTILAQVLFLQNDSVDSSRPRSTSNRLTPTEATELFFAATKLFVSSDASLRRMVYLFLKEIQPLCDPSDVIIVTSCLVRDITTSSLGIYRAHALRVLVHIVDSSMLGNIERYIRQAIVDRDVRVCNAALVCASHWYHQSEDHRAIVQRWIREVQEVLIREEQEQSGSPRRNRGERNMVQMNSMRLLVQIKGRDRLGISKLVQTFSSDSRGINGSARQLHSPLAIVILIRACGRIMYEELLSYNKSGEVDVREVSALCREGFGFMEANLTHPQHLVSYEAARTICLLPNVESQNLSNAIECFHKMLVDSSSSSQNQSTMLRYAAVNSLSQIARHQPRAVARCNSMLEKCLEDSNKGIATMALTTLLNSGTDQSIDRWMTSSISTLLLEHSSEELKITMIHSLHDLCLQYPNKHPAIVGLTNKILLEKGTFEFKNSIVDSIVSLMHQLPELMEQLLLHLCEFIEDCEYAMLSSKVMHVVAKIGPSMPNPSRHVRFLYNRIMLGNATVRASAVLSLTIYAARCPKLRVSIIPLIRHSCRDEDDEVRDRAVLGVKVLEEAMRTNPYTPPIHPELQSKFEALPQEAPPVEDLAMFTFAQPLPISWNTLRKSIEAYAAIQSSIISEEVFSFSHLPIIGEDEEQKQKGKENNAHPPNTIRGQNGAFYDTNLNILAKSTIATTTNDLATDIYAIPDFLKFGKVFRSSTTVPLTEEETEYVVRCTKHILEQHIILQFTVTNTVDGQNMKNVIVAIEGDSDTYSVIGEIVAEKIECFETANCFSVLQRREDGGDQSIAAMGTVHFPCQLNFTASKMDSKFSDIPDDDDDGGSGYREEYVLEDVVISPSDFMVKTSVVDFKKEWTELCSIGKEKVEKFQLQYKELDKAVTAVVELLGMAVCDGTGHKPLPNSKEHMLHLSGMLLSRDQLVLVRAHLSLHQGGTLMKMAIRGDQKSIDAVLSSLNH